MTGKWDMIKLEGLSFNEHRPDSSKKLMSESKDSLFEGKPFDSSLVNDSNTSVSYKAEAGACGPILHGHEGLRAQPTYHGLSRQATNSLEGLWAQVKWSCPALPYAMYTGKTHSYKSYTTNFS